MHVVQATELLALDVFNSGAREITLGDVEHYLGQAARPFAGVPLWTLPGGCDRTS